MKISRFCKRLPMGLISLKERAISTFGTNNEMARKNV